jgi:hypothetical protein
MNPHHVLELPFPIIDARDRALAPCVSPWLRRIAGAEAGAARIVSSAGSRR